MWTEHKGAGQEAGSIESGQIVVPSVGKGDTSNFFFFFIQQRNDIIGFVCFIKNAGIMIYLKI